MKYVSFMGACVLVSSLGTVLLDVDHIVAFYLKMGYISFRYWTYWHLGEFGIPSVVARAWHTHFGISVVALLSTIISLAFIHGWDVMISKKQKKRSEI